MTKGRLTSMAPGLTLRIAILVACYNRKQITLPNLSALFAALDRCRLEYHAYLVDDCSPDGTGDALRQQFPDARVIDGTGTLFWTRGMHKAFSAARNDGPFDAYLLFNDDVAVHAAAVAAFFEEWRECNQLRRATLVGMTTSADGKVITYSGLKIPSRSRPLRNEVVVAAGKPAECDTFNANFVLIPATTMETLGGPDPAFWHGLGDLDLGLRISSQGEETLVATEPIGACDHGDASEWQRTPLFSRFLRVFTGPDGLQYHALFLRRHANGRLWAELLILGRVVKMIALVLKKAPLQQSSNVRYQDPSTR